MELPSPSLVDIVALSLVALAALRGYIRGLSGELFGLIGNAAALTLGVVSGQPLGDWLAQHTRVSMDWAPFAGFVTIVAGAIAVMILIRLTVGRVFKVVVEDGVNRTGGIIAGTLRGLVMVTLVFAAALLAPRESWQRRFGDESAVGTVVRKTVPVLQNLGDRAGDLELPDVEIPAGME